MFAKKKKSFDTIQTNSNSFLIKCLISECLLYLFFPAFSIPFLISKMRIIGKNHLLSHFCCCCHHQPQRCSQPCARLTREGACRGPQTPSCVPSSLWVPGQLHQNHRTAASKSQDTQPWDCGGQKNPQQTQPCVDRTPKGLWLF